MKKRCRHPAKLVETTTVGGHVFAEVQFRWCRRCVRLRAPEVDMAVAFGENPDIDRDGEGFYVAELWPGDDAVGTATLFNVRTERPVSRGFRW